MKSDKQHDHQVWPFGIARHLQWEEGHYLHCLESCCISLQKGTNSHWIRLWLASRERWLCLLMPGQVRPWMRKLTGHLSLHWNLIKRSPAPSVLSGVFTVSRLFSSLWFSNFYGRNTPAFLLLVIIYSQCSVNAQGTGCLPRRENDHCLSGRAWIGNENLSPAHPKLPLQIKTFPYLLLLILWILHLPKRFHERVPFKTEK